MVPLSKSRVILQLIASGCSLALGTLLPFQDAAIYQDDGTLAYINGQGGSKTLLMGLGFGGTLFSISNANSLEDKELDQLEREEAERERQERLWAMQQARAEAQAEMVRLAQSQAMQEYVPQLADQHYSELSGVPLEFIQQQRLEDEQRQTQQLERQQEIQRLQAIAAANEAEANAAKAKAKLEAKPVEVVDGNSDLSKVEGGLKGDRPPIASSEVAPAIQSAQQLLPIYLGRNPQTGERVDWNLPVTGTGNGFLVGFGISGAGKTSAIIRMLNSIQKLNIAAIQFDFHGDMKPQGFQRLHFDFSKDSCGVNPLQIVDKRPGQGGPLLQTVLVMRTLERYIGNRQAAALRRAISAVYDAWGIQQDNPDTWAKDAPTLVDVLGVLEYEKDQAEGAAADSIQGLIDSIEFICQAPVFNKPSVDIAQLCSGYHVLDVSALVIQQDTGLQKDVANLLLGAICQHLRSQGEIPVHPSKPSDRYRVFVGIDEASIMFDGGSKTIEYIVTQMRKFGLGLFMFSQDTEHFTKECLRQIKARILMMLPDDESQLKAIAADLGLGKDGIDVLRSAKGGGHCNFKDAIATTLTELQFELVD